MAGCRKAATWVNSESSQALRRPVDLSLVLSPSLVKRAWAIFWSSGTCCALGNIFTPGFLFVCDVWNRICSSCELNKSVPHPQAIKTLSQTVEFYLG